MSLNSPARAQTTGEYALLGEYHRHLDKRWAHYPIYVEKVRLIEEILDAVPRDAKIVDLGCGEGLLVEKYRATGYDIRGFDLNYQSEHVTKADILHLDLPNDSVDLVLALDVIEHLNFADQVLALDEIRRILKPGGRLIATMPNLAHFSGRVVYLLTGRLLRTSTIERHPGDRPMAEYVKLLRSKFRLKRVRGIFPTLPISSLLTLAFPAAMLPWHRVLNAIWPFPSWCFLNLYDCEKE
jgi:SAM-dependent methyltransferase